MTLPVDVERLLLDLAEEVDGLLRPLVRASRHPAALRGLLREAGWDLDAVAGVPPETAAAAADAAAEALRTAAARLGLVEDLADLGSAGRTALGSVPDVLATLDTGLLAAVLPASGVDAAHRAGLIDELAWDVAGHLLLRRLHERAPELVDLARLTGLVVASRPRPLYLEPEPPAAGEPPQRPLRLPIRRLAVNRRALADTVLLPVSAFVADLPVDSFASPTAFVAGLRSVLEQRMRDAVEPLLRSGVGTVTVAVGAAGVELNAPALLPTTSLSSWPSLDAADRVSIPLRAAADAALPALDIGREAWRLRLADPSREALSVVPGVLELVAGFSGPAADARDPPGVRLTVDTSDPEAPTAELRLTIALALTTESGARTELAASVVAAPEPGWLDLTVGVEALGELRAPLTLPGLTGAALVADEPALDFALADLDPEVRLDVVLSGRGFGIDLPQELFRAVTRADDSSAWEVGGSPRVRLELEGAGDDAQRILELGLAGGGGGLALDRVAFMPGPPRSFGVDIDALLIGTDPEHGFVVEVDHFVLDPDPGAALGAITLDAARLHLPATLPGLPTGIELSDVTIDDAGFSGQAALVFPEPADPGEHERLFGVLPIDFRSVVVELVDNVPVRFALDALVELPWFGDWVGVTIGLDDDLDLIFRIESAEGITVTKDELLALTFRSAGFAYSASTQTLEVSLSGGLQPLLWNADGLEWPRLDVTDLVVAQDLGSLAAGSPEPPVLRFAEAWVDLADLATLDLFGFGFELNRIGVGYLEDTDELWVDLSGSLRLIDLIPVGLGVEGFRIVWPRRIYEELGLDPRELPLQAALDLAARIQVRFAGIDLFFGIPDAVEFGGTIRFLKDAQTVAFAGDVALRVPATGLAVDAGLLVGMNLPPPPEAPFPFLYVHFGVELPTGIPLAQSGLALKGARGLLGLNVEPDREPEQNPYYDWYLRGPIEGAHPSGKWRDRLGSIALGAGVTITTVDGKLFGVRGLFVLVIPGPLVIVEGKALVFDGVFPGDGPLQALGFFDGNELTAQLNVQATLELVEGLVDVAAGLEAFFDFRALHEWHLYLGQDEPPDRRVHANLLKLPAVGWLFGADAWLMLDMLDADTLRSRLGVHIGFEPPSVDLVVASATIRAVLDGEGLLTLNPLQFAGALALEAVLDVDVLGLVVVGVEAAATVAVEGPLPLVADARIAARVDLPVPDLDAVPVVGEWAASALDWFEETVADLPEIPEYVDVEVPLHWELDGPPALDPLVAAVSVESAWVRGGGPALRVDGDAGALDAPVVPLDARPSVVFDQHVGVADGLQLGGFADAGVQRFHAGGLAFRPWLHGIRLWRLPVYAYDPDADEQAWELVGDASSADSALALWGTFRPASSDVDPGVASRRVLDLLTAAPFEYLAGSVALAVPSSSPADDVAPVPRGPAIGGDGGLRWCEDRGPTERCIDGRDLAAAVRRERPRVVAAGDRWSHELVVDGVAFRADDLRVVPRPGGAGAMLAATSMDRAGGRLHVRFPQRVRSVRLTVAPARAAVEARRDGRPRIARDGRITAPAGCAATVAVTLAADGDAVVVEAADGHGVDCLVLSAKGGVELTSLCWTTDDAAHRAAAHARGCADNAALADQAADPGAVLAAGHLYRLELTTATQLDEAASDWETLALASLPGVGAALEPYRAAPDGRVQTDTFLFRTAGPPSDLTPYVRWSSGRSDRPLHLADDDIVVRFARPHLHRMFPDPDNGAPGPAGSPHALEPWIVDADGHVLDGWFTNWTDAGSATLLPEERRWYRDLAGVQPPLDDVLELRRPLALLAGQLGASDWTIDPATPGSGRRTRWQHRPDGSVRLRPGGAGRDLALTGDPSARDLRVDTTIRPDRARGRVGLCVLADGSGHRYELALLPAARRVELTRVDGARSTSLAAASLAPLSGPVAASVEAAERAGQLHFTARVDGVELTARIRRRSRRAGVWVCSATAQEQCSGRSRWVPPAARWRPTGATPCT